MNAGRFSQLVGKGMILLVVVAFFARPQAVHAQSSAGKFLAGAAVGLVAHELGHVTFDLAFGAGVGFKRVDAGPIPFFAITHHPVSPAREFAVSSAGFWVQHATDEWILTRRPQLRGEHAPFVKGLVAFNVLTSVGYSVAAFARSGPAERDTRGMAASARVHEAWIGGAILAPAALDAARYYRGDITWLKWASRATKIGGALLIVRAAT
jgi:hypothetical protein